MKFNVSAPANAVANAFQALHSREISVMTVTNLSIKSPRLVEKRSRMASSNAFKHFGPNQFSATKNYCAFLTSPKMLILEGFQVRNDS